MKARVKSYAKLNLTLDICGSADGYHILDSLVCQVDLFDVIIVSKRKDGLVSAEMHGRGSESIPFEENNAVKAAERYVEAFSTRGADIKIYKNIPIGAGLGGSSADIAGVLRGMNELYGACGEAELKALADELGSDSGYMLTGGYARLGGRGEKTENIDSRLRLDFLLLSPRRGVSAAQCYRAYDNSDFRPERKTQRAFEALVSGDRRALGANLSNALYGPAAELCGDVKTAFSELCEFSPLGVNMTGSGSAVYALFENAEYCSWAMSRYRGEFECIQLKTRI